MLAPEAERWLFILEIAETPLEAKYDTQRAGWLGA